MESAFEGVVGAGKLLLNDETEQSIKEGTDSFIREGGERIQNDYSKAIDDLLQSDDPRVRDQASSLDKFVKDFALYYGTDADFKDTVDASLGILEPLLEGMTLLKLGQVSNNLIEPIGETVKKGTQVVSDNKSKVLPDPIELSLIHI